MTELVMCRRGPERQAGAARPDLVNPAILPSAQPPEPIPCARDLDGLPASASLGQGHTVQPSTVTPTPWLPYVNHPGGAAARAGRSGTGALVAPARARYGLWQSVYGLFRRWQRDGTWRKIVALLLARADAAGLITWDAACGKVWASLKLMAAWDQHICAG